MAQWRRSGSATIAAAAMATAWNAHGNGFVWDDRAAVIGNKDVRSDVNGTALWQVFTNDFWGTSIRAVDSHKSYRPLTVLSFRLNHLLTGFDAQYFHITNTLIHVGCSLLVWRVATVLFRSRTASPSSAAGTTALLEFIEIGAILSGLLFAVHPIHCDAVASVVGRADLLCTLLALQSFLMYVDAVKKSESPRWSAFALALATAVGGKMHMVASLCVASLCKELGFTVFGLFVAYDATLYFSRREARSDDRANRIRVHGQRIALVALFVVSVTVVRVWVNGEHRQVKWTILANNVVVQTSKVTRMLSYAHIHAWYLWKLVWPRSLSFDYGFKTVPLITTIWDSHNLYTLAAYGAVLAGVVAGVKQVADSPLLICIAFGVIPFIPASNLLFPVGTVVAERLLYFPSVGFCLLVGYMVQEALAVAYKYGSAPNSGASDAEGDPEDAIEEEHRQKPRTSFQTLFRRFYASIWLCCCFLLVCGCYRSRIRNAEWVSETSLFEAAVKVTPTNNKALTNVGKTLLHRDEDLAIQYLRVATAILPRQIVGHTNLGLAHWGKEEWLYAARHLYKATQFGDMQDQSAGYFGAVLMDTWLGEGREAGLIAKDFLSSPTIQHAVTYLDTAIRFKSGSPHHYYTRARLAYLAGEYDDAIRFARATLQVNENVRETAMDTELLMSPGQVYNMIAVSYMAKGRKDLALETIIAGLEIAPREIDLHVNAATIYAGRQEIDKGNHHIQAALQFAMPTHASNLHSAARVMDSINQQDAAAAFRRRADSLLARNDV